MKRIIGLTFAIFAIGIIFSMDSYAQGKRRPAGINQRQQNQKQRIVNGVRSRELTGHETYRLVREQNQIRRMENRFRQSGDGLSRRERARLQYELYQSSHHIYKQKHDKQDYPKPQN